ncbi:uncharacterized protein OCT59_026532 [Rhizophagus irregularis]|uniref:uncharacterized protein n=1 Tax=Rhizophagus irregularis TaxID=588596 RepID=UPI00332945D4|nr:hypothetical protein OCT59_026532 [Rhizophagus irregularis]
MFYRNLCPSHNVHFLAPLTNTIKFRNYFYSRLIFFVMKKKLNEIIHGDLVRIITVRVMGQVVDFENNPDKLIMFEIVPIPNTNRRFVTFYEINGKIINRYIYIQLNTLFCLLIAVSKLKTSADRLNRRSIIQRNRLFKIADYVNP